MGSRRHLLTSLAAAWAGLVQGQAWAQAGTEAIALRVAAASDMQFALTDLAGRFERETGRRIVLQSGSSGNLARQIMQGLAVDLFFSADESYVFKLADAGLTQGRGARYASGRLALLAHMDSTLALDGGMTGLRAQTSALRRFAIANPEHAPYGRAAREAMQAAGIWSQLSSRLVLGENVAHATQFVASGAAQAGIVSLSMARSPDVARVTRHVVLNADLHSALHQRLVLMKAAPAAAQSFVEFIGRPDMRQLLQRHGFADPA